MKVLIDPKLRDHKKLLRLAKALKISRPQAAGHLLLLWAHAIEHALDGTLSMEDSEICHYAGWDGDAAKFCAALRDLHWLDGDTIHDWQEHQGQYIERLMKERERKRKWYHRKQESPAPTPASKPQPPLVAPEPAVTSSFSVSMTPYEEALFDMVWRAYPCKEAKEKARQAWKRIFPKPDNILADKMLKTIEAYKTCDRWRSDGGRYVPHLHNWLDEKRWEDEPPESSDTAVESSIETWAKKHMGGGE